MFRRPHLLVVLLTGLLGLLACQDDLGLDPAGGDGSFASTEPGSTDYEVVPIEVPGGGFGRAHAVNDSNVVVGVSEIDGDLRAFRWAGGTAEELGGLGGSVSGAYAINDRGVIVGEAENAEGHLRAVAWIDGEVVELGTLGGATSQALAVNDRGQVAGRAQNEEGEYRPFLWWQGRMRELPLPPGGGSFASADGLNPDGEVVGTVATESSQKALLWAGTRVRVLETTCTTAIASDINDRRQIVGDGAGCDVSPAVGVPLLWNGDEPALHLEPLGGLISSPPSPTHQNGGEATSISSRGEIVGWSTLRPDDFEAVRATLWYRDGVVNLGGEPGSGRLRFTGAADINDLGTAVGVSAETAVLFVAGAQRELLADRVASASRNAVLEAKPDAATEIDVLFGSRAAEAWAEHLCGGNRHLSGPPTVGEILAGC